MRNLKLDDTLLAIWFVHVSDMSNWMYALNRDDGDKLLHQWRMRYFPKGSGLFDDDEWSNWYSGSLATPLPQAVEQVQRLVRILSEHAHGPIFELLRGERPPEAFLVEFFTQPWVHRRPGPDGDDITLKLL